jgi:hypothetical protein
VEQAQITVRRANNFMADQCATISAFNGPKDFIF